MRPGPKPLPVRERLFSRLVIDPESGCLLWTAGRDIHGYGYLVVSPGKRKRRVHRLMYEMFAGPIPEGLELDHLCRNRACANVAHLEPVTHRENILRGYSPHAINATKTHCPAGHAYDDINTYVKRQHDGTGFARNCRACQRERRLLAALAGAS